jgi:hypothetical protein
MLLLLPAGCVGLAVPASAEPKQTTSIIIQNKATTSGGVSGNETGHAVESRTTITVTGSKSFSTPYGSHLEPILQKIGASQDQRKRISAIVQSYRPKIEPLRVEYRAKSKEFIEYIIEGKPAELIMARQGELNNIYGVITTDYSLMRLEIRRSLTPQQCKEFEEYRAQQGWRSK